ncbi:MAG TPA: hypothetical protein VJM33_02210 [Microthrixaceae bacterium]|nr:hypothetical protein [Microthrixaceae bacterium]
MTHLRTLVGPFVVAVALVCGITGCSRPEENPPLVVTGDPAAANPEHATTTAPTTTAPTTTLYYSGE